MNIGSNKTITFIGKAVESDTAKRTRTFVISAEVVDADREVVITKGVSIENFRPNPVVCYMHDSWAVIGKSLWEKKQTKEGIPQMVAKVQFMDSELANDVWHQCDTDFLRGASIGCPWSSLTYKDCTPEDVKDNPHYKGARSLIVKSELREWSIVSIPSCPLALALEKGLITEHTKHYFTEVVPEQRVRPFRVIELSKEEKKFLTPAQAEVIIKRRAAFLAGRI